MGPRLFSRGNLDASIVLCAATMLQWGHDFSAVEMRFEIITGCPEYVASMGPRLFSRGNRKIYLVGANDERCFNGATTFQPWKSVFAGSQT